MPWKTSSVMEEKLRFIFEHELQERTMSELCERYEITRQTGYVWLRRYREAGVDGLTTQSRAAHRHRNQTPEELEQRVLGLRQAHMRQRLAVGSGAHALLARHHQSFAL
ncbi:MAG TPA: helix-turn-helix domain-containing protein [Candidatus Acidoferrum sp.]|nr:helix-turn-helix domain-containing protein [Candidatus Acidoferrum sp.]